jgi:hypothetical protein
VKRAARAGLGEHLVLGLGLLWKRWAVPLGRWRTGGTRPGDRAIRTACLAGAGLAVIGVLHAAWPLLFAAAFAVVAAALRAATRHVTERPAEAAADVPLPAAQDVDQEQSADPTPDQFLGLLHRVIGTAGGVHLRTLAAALTEQYGGTWEIAEVRRLCEAAGQATRPVVRAPGAGPTVGIHREDLLPLPQPPAPAPGGTVVVAGQPTTTGPTTAAPTTPTTPITTVIGGVRVTTAADPGNPHRHTVRVTDTARRRRP